MRLAKFWLVSTAILLAVGASASAMTITPTFAANINSDPNAATIKATINAAIAIFLLSSGISARLRDWAERHTRFKAMQVTHYAIAFLILNAVLSFPLSVYEGFYREHQYGLATQTFGGWFGDQLKGLGFALKKASASMIMPGMQYPHCTAC